MQNKLKLLIADDHILFSEGIKTILNKKNNIIVIETAVNGEEVIEKCTANAIDIVLMDINMPVKNGIETTLQLKQLQPEIKIIIVSMLDDPTSIHNALKAGADAYILKNSGIDELLHALKKIQGNEKYLPHDLEQSYFKFISDESQSNIRKSSFTQELTRREKQIIKHIAEGLTNTEIAEILFISKATAETHRKNILSKLGLKNTAALVRFASENGLI